MSPLIRTSHCFELPNEGRVLVYGRDPPHDRTDAVWTTAFVERCNAVGRRTTDTDRPAARPRLLLERIMAKFRVHPLTRHARGAPVQSSTFRCPGWRYEPIEPWHRFIGTSTEARHSASGPGNPIPWASQDGLSWSTALGSDEPISDGGIGFGSGDEHFTAIGRGRSWTSLDGVSWTLHEQSNGAPDGTDALALGADGRLVAVGTRYDGSDADPWITVAELEGSD